MDSGRIRASRLAALLSLPAMFGCYQPNIAPGKLICAKGNICPDGYTCAADQRCYPASQGSKDGGTDACASSLPKVTCATPPTLGQTCNPTCQTGCSCGEWCAVVGGSSKCVSGTPGTKTIADICDPASGVDCQPGLVCRPECGTTTVGRCYKPCATTADCDTSCGATLNTTFRLCNLPPQACNPVGSATTGCPSATGATFVCYDAAGSTSCECAGSIGSGDVCVVNSSCVPGFRCVGNGGSATCKQTCQTSSDCATGTPTCSPLSSQDSYGYCS